MSEIDSPRLDNRICSRFIPCHGPASSQTGFLIGLRQAGWTCALAAWLAFTLPSALLMFVFAVMAPKLTSPLAQGVIHGLKLVAVAVVAQAVWSMGKKLCTDRLRISLALAAFLVVLLVAAPGAQEPAGVTATIHGDLAKTPLWLAERFKQTKTPWLLPRGSVL